MDLWGKSTIAETKKSKTCKLSRKFMVMVEISGGVVREYHFDFFFLAWDWKNITWVHLIDHSILVNASQFTN